MKKKRAAGFTLIEATIALAIWVMLTASVLLVWHHVSNRTNALLARQNALENARVAMDALVVNIQMAYSITLYIGPGFDLRELALASYDTGGGPHTYRFFFNSRLLPTATTFRRLNFGGPGNELASNIADVRVQPMMDKRHLRITITTGCEYPIVLESSVDIRYKHLSVVDRFP